MGIVLRCTEGPCAGETITIDSELLLGREQPDPGRLGGDERLSRRHARLFIDDSGRAVVEDLGSTNGTWINQQQLTEARVCANGDVLRVGQSTFELELPTGARATTFDTVVEAAPRTVADAPQPPPTPLLVVTAGPKQGEEIPLGEELLVGRSFGEPGGLGGDKRLSRRHARIARGPGGVFFIEDTGSSNGTMVNRVAIRRAQPLKDGDEIAVGSSTLQAHGLPRAPIADEPEPRFAADHVKGPTGPAAIPAPATPGRAIPGQAIPGQAIPGQAIPGQAIPGQAIPEPAIPAHRSGQFVPQGAASGRLSARRGRVVGVFAALFAAAAAVSVAAIVLFAPLGTRTCPSGFVCQKPLTAPPLRALKTFSGSLGWRVEYDAQSTVIHSASAAANEIELNESSSYDTHQLRAPADSKTIAVLIRGYRTTEVSPQAALAKLADPIASNLVGATTAPSSDQLFVRPVLGFHTAVGEVLEGNARTPQGPGPLVKLAVVAASSGGVTVAMALLYPVQLGQNQGSNPDGPFDFFGDQILGTVRFASDGAA